MILKLLPDRLNESSVT